MDEINNDNVSDAITKLIATELVPKMREYQNEMVSARDTLFGELIKGVTVWEFPALTLAHFTNLGITEGIAAFVAGLIVVE